MIVYVFFSFVPLLLSTSPWEGWGRAIPSFSDFGFTDRYYDHWIAASHGRLFLCILAFSSSDIIGEVTDIFG